MGSKPLYHKHGTHPLIESYNRIYKSGHEALARIEEAKKDHTRPKPIYKMGKVVKGTPDGPDVIYFELHLFNRAELDEYDSLWGSSAPSDEDKRCTTGYRYYQDTVIVHGSGYHFLQCTGRKPPINGGNIIPCTADEWYHISHGWIPKKFRPDWYRENPE